LIEDFRVVLSRLRPDWDSSRATGIRHLSGGYANDNYAFDYDRSAYVLRIVRPGVPGPIPRGIERDLLRGPLAGLTAPILAYALPEGHLLSRYVDGDLLIERGADIAELAAYLSALHSRLSPFGWEHPIDHLINGWFEAAAGAGYRVEPVWRNAVAGLPSPAAVEACHNDLNPWNVIVRGGGEFDWCTLDWEWCGDNDPFFDVVALARGLGLPLVAEDELIGRYAVLTGRQRPSTDAEVALRTRFHLRELAWALATMALRGESAELTAQVRNSARALEAFIR